MNPSGDDKREMRENVAIFASNIENMNPSGNDKPDTPIPKILKDIL